MTTLVIFPKKGEVYADKMVTRFRDCGTTDYYGTSKLFRISDDHIVTGTGSLDLVKNAAPHLKNNEIINFDHSDVYLEATLYSIKRVEGCVRVLRYKSKMERVSNWHRPFLPDYYTVSWDCEDLSNCNSITAGSGKDFASLALKFTDDMSAVFNVVSQLDPSTSFNYDKGVV